MKLPTRWEGALLAAAQHARKLAASLPEPPKEDQPTWVAVAQWVEFVRTLAAARGLHELEAHAGHVLSMAHGREPRSIEALTQSLDLMVKLARAVVVRTTMVSEDERAVARQIPDRLAQGGAATVDPFADPLQWVHDVLAAPAPPEQRHVLVDEIRAIVRPILEEGAAATDDMRAQCLEAYIMWRMTLPKQ